MKLSEEIRDIALSQIPTAHAFWAAIKEHHGTPVGQVICAYSSDNDRLSLWNKPEEISMALLFVAEAIEQEAV